MDYLESSHYGVQLTPEEKERVACWIDLNVPFAGSWMELNYWHELDHATHSGLTPWYVYRDKMRRSTCIPLADNGIAELEIYGKDL